MSAVNVKNHIAAFEAQSSRMASPRSAGSPRLNGDRDGDDGTGASFGGSSQPQHQRSRSSSNGTYDSAASASVARSEAHSATDLASQSRRDRLSSVQPLQPSQPSQPSQTKGTPAPHPSPPSSATNLSLAERRMQRQQRKAHLMQKKQKSMQRTSARSAPAPATPERLSTSVPPPASRVYPNYLQDNNHSSHLSFNYGDRRFVHTVSAESFEDYASVPSSLASAVHTNSAKLQRLRRDATYEDDSTYNNGGGGGSTILNSVVGGDATDDEATLTSVRQIMNTPLGQAQPQHHRFPMQQQYQSMQQQQQQHRQAPLHHQQQRQHQQRKSLLTDHNQAGQRPMALLRTASSSSYEADRQLLFSSQHAQELNTTHTNDDDSFDYGSIVGSNDQYPTNRTRRGESSTGSRRANDKRKPNRNQTLQTVDSPLLNQEDMEHYRKKLDTPLVKTVAGIAAAATVGTVLIGPVGLLVGAATFCIGAGVMQIPQEQRDNMTRKAAQALEQAHEQAMHASESACGGGSTASTMLCQGVLGDGPHEMMTQCFSVTTPDDLHMAAAAKSNNGRVGSGIDHQGSIKKDGLNLERARSEKNGEMGNALEGGANNSPGVPGSGRNSGGKNRRVACLRKARITPVDQIHGLAPHQQPRAWLDVVANANTTADEKSEAMEEIMILAKDKRHARFLLDEGILDSLMYILNRHFNQMENCNSSSNGNGGATTINSNGKSNNSSGSSNAVNGSHGPVAAGPRVEAMQARLAASCCITLGKAHCAAVHTEGDLLLMSLYERGSVPEERQLAQMLYEVPHHVASSSSSKEQQQQQQQQQQSADVVFVLQQLSMSQAEELATRIKSLGR